MSEYQYYEFQAIDKPLDEKDIQALRNLSSRPQITPTSFVNEYNWGDFKGNPLKLMEKYFDAFFYFANWGTHWLMLRVPLRLINFDLAKKYCFGENATAYKKGENLIFEFVSEADDYEWEEGEGRLSSLISLRLDIIRGDYRCLYLAKREDNVWEKVNDLIEKKRPVDYDEAVKLLLDLHDLSKKINNETTFKENLRSIYEKHSRKPSLVRRLENAGLDG